MFVNISNLAQSLSANNDEYSALVAEHILARFSQYISRLYITVRFHNLERRHKANGLVNKHKIFAAGLLAG